MIQTLHQIGRMAPNDGFQPLQHRKRHRKVISNVYLSAVDQCRHLLRIYSQRNAASCDRNDHNKKHKHYGRLNSSQNQQAIVDQTRNLGTDSLATQTVFLP
jgi:hypothetical protein